MSSLWRQLMQQQIHYNFHYPEESSFHKFLNKFQPKKRSCIKEWCNKKCIYKDKISMILTLQLEPKSLQSQRDKQILQQTKLKTFIAFFYYYSLTKLPKTSFILFNHFFVFFLHFLFLISYIVRFRNEVKQLKQSNLIIFHMIVV